MQGKVLFIIHDLYQEDNSFPLGVGYMAAMLKREYVDVDVCCADIYHYTNEELAEKYLKPNSYDLICVGFLAARFKETVLDLCKTINQHKKNAWLVLGGYGASPIPDYILKTTQADIVAIGEAEETIVEILKCKINDYDLRGVEGIAFREDDNVFINKLRRPIANLDTIPLPAWEIFPMDKYTTCCKLFNQESNDKVFLMTTSRGCCSACSFCVHFNPGMRFRSVKNVVEEMLVLQERYGVNYFWMMDDLFVFSKKRVFEFQDELKKNDLKIKFVCDARVDIFDEEIVQTMKDMGCQFINIGFESSSQKVLDLMHKNTTVEQNIRAAEITKKAGIGFGLNFLWGLPEDDENSLRGNVALIRKYNPYYQLRTIRPVTPYPGSALYYEAIERGFLQGADDFFEKFKNSDLLTVNFTNIPNDKFYELLFEANKELIIDHFAHTTKDMVAADNLIANFHGLYFEGQTKFRGARHYAKK